MSIRPLLFLTLLFASSAVAAPLHPVYDHQSLVRQGYLSIALFEATPPRVFISTAPDASADNEDSVELVTAPGALDLLKLAHTFGHDRLAVVTGTGNAQGQINVSALVEAPAAELTVRQTILRDATRRYKKTYQPTGDAAEDAIRITNLWKDDRDPMYSVTVENWGGYGTAVQRRVRTYWYETNGAFRTEVWP